MKKNFYPLSSLLFVLFFHHTLFAQQFSLVKNINYPNPSICTGTSGQPVQNLIELNGFLYFTASGAGFWKTDGTAGGTIQVKAGVTIQNIIDANGTLYFTTTNQQLWKSDGTELGTVMVKNFSTGLMSNLVNADGVLYFKEFSSNSYQLWKSDGTEAGTQLVKAFTNLDMISYGGETVFVRAADGPPYIATLWKSDGTEAGTAIVRNNLSVSSMFSANGIFYFVGSDGATGSELWTSDGTEAGTALVKDLEPGAGNSDPQNFTVAGGFIYFFAGTSATGWALWKTDGTDAGTAMVKAITASTDLTNVNGTLFFRGYDSTNGWELWKSDGTDAGTAMVKDIYPGNSGNPANLTNVNGTLFFTAFDEVQPQGVSIICANTGELWKSDGTDAGTVKVKDIYKGAGYGNPSKLISANGLLFFTATDGLSGTELWKSNGTAGGTTIVKELFTDAGSNPRYFTIMNGVVYFTAFESNNGPSFSKGTEMQRTDGTLTGTYQLGDIHPLGNGNPNQFTAMNGTLYFSADNGSHGQELYLSDGIYSNTVNATSHTRRVKDINPYLGSIPYRGSNPSSLTPFNGILYFSASNYDNGYELWKSDGTEAGTVMIKDIYPGIGFSNPANLVILNNGLYFSADDGVNGKELWKSDGTEAGTVLVKNINAGGSSDLSGLTVIDNLLYFAANDGGNGMELWKSDGTEAGTVLVKDINNGTSGSNPAQLININGVLYFIADNGTEGIELWKSDGTEAGTVLVKDINGGVNGSGPASLTNLNGIIYFSADDGLNGREVWKSNGTEAGTVLIKNISTGGGSDPGVLTRIGNNILFAANDGVFGKEIWITNGTEAGTRMMQDVEPGAGSSDPTELLEFNGKVLMAASNSFVGNELWIADVPADSPLPLTLLEFKGSIVNSDGQLQWKTDNEMNTSSFIIERSIDGRNYKSVGSVTSANTPGIHYYNFIDADIASLGIPDFYYRLKQTDIDGKYTYSNIVVLSVTSGKNFVLLYPNPVKDKINMTVNVSQKEKLQWQLTDNMGRRVKAGSYDLSPGSIAVSIDIAGLSSGMYLIQLNSSSLQKVIKVIKQ
ncbi:MAG: ELWxxDGT repeat protein [Chitinophagaceae bacterium]